MNPETRRDFWQEDGQQDEAYCPRLAIDLLVLRDPRRLLVLLCPDRLSLHHFLHLICRDLLAMLQHFRDRLGFAGGQRFVLL